jgi:hypothetical protein
MTVKGFLKRCMRVGHQWFMLIILVTQGAEIKRIIAQANSL